MYVHFEILLIRDNYITYLHTADSSVILFSGCLPLIKNLRARNFAELFSNTCLTITVKINKIGQLCITYGIWSIHMYYVVCDFHQK